MFLFTLLYSNLMFFNETSSEFWNEDLSFSGNDIFSTHLLTFCLWLNFIQFVTFIWETKPRNIWNVWTWKSCIEESDHRQYAVSVVTNYCYDHLSDTEYAKKSFVLGLGESPIHTHSGFSQFYRSNFDLKFMFCHHDFCLGSGNVLLEDVRVMELMCFYNFWTFKQRD